MVNHSRTIVPIEAWSFNSPDVKSKGIQIDIGLMAEALIYYDSIFVNIQNEVQFAEFINWFARQNAINTFQKMLREKEIIIYEYSFLSVGIRLPTGLGIMNIQSEDQAKPNSFGNRFFKHEEVRKAIPQGEKGELLRKTISENALEVKADGFGPVIESARDDVKDPRRVSLLLQSFLDELYTLRAKGKPPKIEANLVPISKIQTEIHWGVNIETIKHLAGKNLYFHDGQILTASAVSHRLIWSASDLGSDLYVGKPLSTIIGDKLFETASVAMKRGEIIQSLQKAVEFPDIRELINTGKINLEDVLAIRQEAKKFREWLQDEKERDRDAIIAYHSEISERLGLNKLGVSVIKLFGVLGGAVLGEVVKANVGAHADVIGAVSGKAAADYVIHIAERMANQWKPIVFGSWMRDRIDTLLEAWKE